MCFFATSPCKWVRSSYPVLVVRAMYASSLSNATSMVGVVVSCVASVSRSSW